MKNLSIKISDPTVLQDQKRMAKLCKEHSDMENIVTVYKEYKEVLQKYRRQ